MTVTSMMTKPTIVHSERTIQAVHQLFDCQVAQNPKKIALVHRERQLSYGELNSLANNLACRLLDYGIKTDSLVGVYIDRSPEMIISILGIIKAGGAYLPLDTSYPIERIDFMIADSRANLIITSAAKQNELTHFSRILVIDSCPEYLESSIKINLNPTTCEDDLIYVNYTSGSTGQPKGVAIAHRSVLHLLQNPKFVKLDKNTVMLQLAPATFDAFTFELWGALLHGGKCILHHETLPTLWGIREAINNHSVTIMFLTTSLFNLIIDEDLSILSGLKQLVVGGEAQSIKHIRKALAKLPNVEIINAYGPTECTTFSTWHVIREHDCLLASIPIGHPINEASVYILDDQYQLVPTGVIGNMYISGPGLAREYLNSPELTDRKFITNLPFLKPEQRVYQTGDLARALPDGRIEYIGRADNQVKIHGFRIELGEIESALNSHKQIKCAIVALDSTSQDNKKLVAYLLPEMAPLEKETVNTYLRAKLPRYMIPSQYIWLKTIPLTANGKLDRKRIISTKGEI